MRPGAMAAGARRSFKKHLLSGQGQFPDQIRSDRIQLTDNMAKSKGPKVYAVARGRVPGIYNTWSECQSQVRVPPASHRCAPSFPSVGVPGGVEMNEVNNTSCTWIILLRSILQHWS